MRSSIIKFVFIFLAVRLSLADIYLHNPRGSNNRLDEKSAARTNANRLFDSQNNNRGGYNVGDATSVPANGKEELQYQMKYFQSDDVGDTVLEIEWTMQHGCGVNKDKNLGQSEVDCNVVLQYMCQDTEEYQKSYQRVRDGTSTATQDFTADTTKVAKDYFTDAVQRVTQNIKPERGFHESWTSYEKCRVREKNTGLFTADVTLKKNGQYVSAIHTRQNPNGVRYGYECPEEKDYYPYWHPTAWKDIAILVTNTADCGRLKSSSFNVKPKYECFEVDSSLSQIPSRWNNEGDCLENGGHWLRLYNYLDKAKNIDTPEECRRHPPVKRHRYIWGIPHDSSTLMPECLVALKPPECELAPWSRANHLGNSDNEGSPSYTWTLPYFPSGKNQTCVFRVRYNISSSDYDRLKTDSNYNQKKEQDSPVKKNPTFNLDKKAELQLTLDTTQLGRTFQDRSHVFILMPRPSALKHQQIHNLNVRGKRGNIVQTYPATEYDFAPTAVRMKQNELLHIQWTGSNTHNNENPAGNGQAGADGVGTEGTDRHNIVEIKNLGMNYPVPMEESTLWNNSTIQWISFKKNYISPLSLAVNLASSGFYRCVNNIECPEPEHKGFTVETKGEKLNAVLNNAPASYEGVVLQIQKGTYFIMCTRNNNFSNRSQKRAIIVE